MTARPRLVLLPETIHSWARPAGGRAPWRWEGRAMGTVWRVTAYPGSTVMAQPQEIRRGIEQRLERIVRQMSHYDPESDLCRYNRAPAGSWIFLPEEFCSVLRCAMEIASASQGWFDPALGEAISLWGFGPEEEERNPTAWQALDALNRCGWERLRLDTGRRAAWQPGGLRLNLGAIAKGYAVDAVAGWLRQCGVASALAEIGGELCGWGVKPDGTPWWVEIENPPHDADAIPHTVVALCGLSIASSGDWVQRRRAGQRSVCHLIDPSTGAPVEGYTAGAAVIHESCMLADAWATALSVAPPRAAMRLAQWHGLAARLLYRKPCGRACEWLSPAMQAMAV